VEKREAEFIGYSRDLLASEINDEICSFAGIHASLLPPLFQHDRTFTSGQHLS
jgi:hypothetical protein